MPRDYKISLQDIVQAIELIEVYVKGLSAKQFRAERMTQDAVVRNLEVIGEAVKNIPESVRDSYLLSNGLPGCAIF
jgi:uncharacterized protein with HEPN domain